MLPLLLNDVVQTDEVCYTEGVDRRVCEEIERADTCGPMPWRWRGPWRGQRLWWQSARGSLEGDGEVLA